jgi:hypothetical protein
MKSITNALNNIAIALGNIALAIDAKNKNSFTPSNSITSNNSPKPTSTTITSVDKHVHIRDAVNIDTSADVYNKMLYEAFTSKGSNPKHYDSMMDDLRRKWPVLFYALSDFARFHEKANKRISSYNQDKRINKDIWKK